MLSTLLCWFWILMITPVGVDAEEPPPRPPNIVYILADDLGYGEVGCYGQKLIRTPRIDHLAGEGMKFTQHYSGSTVCAPSRCVLLTGTHTGKAIVRNNSENGGWGANAAEGQHPLPDETITVAEELQDHGYATACIGKWGLGGPNTEGHPNNQGFDLFYGYLCQRKAHNYYPAHLWRNDEKHIINGGEFYKAHQKIKAPLESEQAYWDRYNRSDYAPDLMQREAVKFINEHADEPFFLYYASPIPHVALQVPPEEVDAYPRSWDEKPYLGTKGYLPHPRPRAGYAAMISRFDTEVGAILDALEAQGIADDTIVIVSSDNGPTWAGGVDADFFDSNGPWRGLKGSLFEGGIRVPMIVRWPGRVKAGSVSDHVSSFQDVRPTLKAVAGIESTPSGTGTSFLPTLRGQAQSAPASVYWEHGPKQAVRKGRWKGLRRRLKQGSTRIELFDLIEDPGETTDVAASHPDIVEAIAKIMDESHTPSAVFPLATIDEKPGKS